MRITIKDCIVQHFRSGGPGGQNQNVRDTGTRIIHSPSGARGESREFRTQGENKKAAFRRMATSPLFRAWVLAQMNVDNIPASRSMERVRTDNIADRYVKDHRTGAKSTAVEAILDGDLDLIRKG